MCIRDSPGTAGTKQEHTVVPLAHVSDQGAVQVEPVRIGFQRQPNLTLYDQHNGLVQRSRLLTKPPNAPIDQLGSIAARLILRAVPAGCRAAPPMVRPSHFDRVADPDGPLKKLREQAVEYRIG